MKKFYPQAWLSSVTLVFVVSLGCDSTNTTGEAVSASPRYDASYIVAAEPSQPVHVGAARQSAKDQDTIDLVGRIGGSASPFVNGLAAFTLVDVSLPDCAGEEECTDGSCCSPEELKANLATVKFVGDTGKPIPIDARELLNVSVNAKVAVHGTVKRDDLGNLTVLADKVYLYQD